MAYSLRIMKINKKPPSQIRVILSNPAVIPQNKKNHRRWNSKRFTLKASGVELLYKHPIVSQRSLTFGEAEVES